jgi:hypothetical protein
VRRAAWAPLGLLLAYGLAWAARALGGSVLWFDDHPAQFFRLWHGLTHGLAPWTWNPDWWMGYPELQFYPPGFVYLGAALHLLTLGRLSPAVVYQLLLWIIFLAPGVTAFLFLARQASNPWLALPGAFLALTFSAEVTSGVEGGVRTGMIAARLGWALVPVLLLSLARWVEAGGPRPALVAPVLAAITLAHPAHLPAAVLYLGLAAVIGRGYRPYRLFQAAWLAVAAALLTAFWTVPLLAHLGESRALAWGDPAGEVLRRLLGAGPLPTVLLCLAGVAALVRRDRVAVVMTAYLPVMLLAIALEGSTRLPANRLVDGLVMGGLLAAGLGTARLLEVVIGRTRTRWAGAAPVAVAAVLTLAALSLRPPQALALWPNPAQWPTRAQIERKLRLPALWEALRAGPAGRVLFLRSGAPLVPGSEWYRPHTHATALTPIYAGRPIVNGTFTHPSPIAALVYTGSPAARPITQLVEQLDGERLFGRPLGLLDTSTLDRFAALLGVSTIVMLEVDRGHIPALEANPAWAPTDVSPWVLYQGRAPVVLPEEDTRERWRIVLDGDPGSWVSARIAFSPLWRAEAGADALAVRRGELGDLEVQLPRPTTAVDLVYRDGQWERAGIVLAALGALLWAARWLTPRRPA